MFTVHCYLVGLCCDIKSQIHISDSLACHINTYVLDGRTCQGHGPVSFAGIVCTCLVVHLQLRCYLLDNWKYLGKNKDLELSWRQRLGPAVLEFN